jgi:DNA (cytosine-5)-methyltransferase 1
MTKEIVMLDLFSGIGGFAKGFEDAGFIIKKHYFSEIDKHAIANYKYNFKNSEYVGPIQSITGAALGKVDVITFGSPCQDFSVAGQRAGLDGERSSLILEAIKIIIEKKPSFFIWENVKGTFSSNNGADFWAILQEFANIGGYNIEWQLLNTLWLLPQNRERIYLVGHLASAGRDFRPIFPFTKNDRLFNEPKGTTGRQSQAEYSKTLHKGSLRADSTYLELPNKAGTLS